MPAENFWARAASPSITGTIGCAPGLSAKPAWTSPSRNRAALAMRRRRRSGAPSIRSRAAGGGGKRVGEEIGPGTLAKEGDDGFGAADVTPAGSAQRFAQGAGEDVDPSG